MGAYTTGVLTAYHGAWPFFLVLRSRSRSPWSPRHPGRTDAPRGDYLAIVTLGFGEIIRICLVNIEDSCSRGIKTSRTRRASAPTRRAVHRPQRQGPVLDPRLEWDGLVPHIDNDHPTSFLDLRPNDSIPYYWLLPTVLILVIIGDRLVSQPRRPRPGRRPRGRGTPPSWMGVPTFRFKLMAFALGAAIGGPVGLVRQQPERVHQPAELPALLSMLFVARVIVRRLRQPHWGAVAGGALVASPTRALPRHQRLPAAAVRARADGAGDLAARGPAATSAHPPGEGGRGRDRCPGGRRADELEEEPRNVESPDAPETVHPSYQPEGSPKALLEVDHVTLKFGGLTALNDVSFNINEGEILGLIGPNGAGKTTCFNVTGVYRPTSGQVRFDGSGLTKIAAQDHQAGLARTFQNIRLFKSMTVSRTSWSAPTPTKGGFWTPCCAPAAPAHHRVRSRASGR